VTAMDKPIRPCPAADPDAVEVVYRNLLVGGEPGSGKSGLLAAAVVQAVLSPSGDDPGDPHGDAAGEA
jgi:hypothetical protein